tara:strand:- start:44 stop:181 length:138 start_codon:yes stop_codon:yes gene_type:complete
MQIYKKIEQSEKRIKRSVDVSAEELAEINTINQNFVTYFKNKHLS